MRSLAAVFVLVSALAAQDHRTPVTPAAGESWLSHLHRSFEETSMGKTGHLGPSPDAPEQPAAVSFAPLEDLSRVVTLRGADLYRLNCQGCHGEAGLGAPPEIGSVINPVRSTSVPLVIERMRSVGGDITRAQAAELAQQSRKALLERIHHGGQDMPAFSHLNDAEVRALLAYLGVLAGVPGAAARQATVAESQDRVGELIVKSTCHVCHGATGPNPDSKQLAAGAIPPLSTLTSRTTPEGLIRKVTQGAPIVMGTPPLLLRGRMPVFQYLSATEAAAVYGYLAAHPPALEPDTRIVAHAQSVPSSPDPSQSSTASQASTRGRPASAPQPASSPDRVWLLSASLVALGILAGGFVITLREFSRLASEAEIRKCARILQFPPAVTVITPSVWEPGAEPAFPPPLNSQEFSGNQEANFY